ncbi:MAG: ribose-5-phosphate isomerase RpiA [Spirochaetaceae bacterium]|nr:ribose-5-phosphate isomerase RpiA [Spirochaetaceae bacterium]
MNQSEQKRLAARTAVDALFSEGKIFSGMKIGLGTGSTALPAVERLAELLAQGSLRDIRAAVTSLQTEIACEGLGIPVYSLNAGAIGGRVDLTIDGADEVDPGNHLIKGGGGALLAEKITAYNSRSLVIVADQTKAVDSLGTKFPVPVEVIPPARVPVINALRDLGASPAVREAAKKCGPVITDNGNILIDCLWRRPVDPEKMETLLNGIPGVVENGFFTRLRPTVFIARGDGAVERREAQP